jgi:predicted dehydrogenase
MGTGAIARKFASDLVALPGAKLLAVGSRSQTKADDFGREFNLTRCYPSYEELVGDSEVDAIYVATPHSCHKDNTLLALSANKPVLVEKPFAINAREAEVVIRAARDKQLLVMDAMWTRFVPLYVRLRELLREGTVGPIQSIRADFGFQTDPATHPRLFDPSLGGGALLDVGVYPISLASMVLGSPVRVSSEARMGATGVDEHDAMVFAHQHGQLALLACAITLNTSLDAMLIGERGSIWIHPPFWKAKSMTLTREDGRQELLEFPFEGLGYQFEAIEFMDCLRSGRVESEIMPLDESLSIMKILDLLRKQWGLKYPMD